MAQHDAMALLMAQYGLTPLSCRRSGEGVGSDTYFVHCCEGTFVVKFPDDEAISHPEQESALCAHLLTRGIPASRFLGNLHGQVLSRDDEGRRFHVQSFVEGKTHALNTAPGWLLTASADMLGRIHAVLRDYSGLPEGIGEGFFRHMTPQRAMASYRCSLETALQQGRTDLAEEIRWRMGLMERYPELGIDVQLLTCVGTHGDYTISQLICGDGEIRAVIDWTAACVHPAVWELMRSYAYAAPECARGEVDARALADYVRAYRARAPLSEYDVQMLLPVYFHQMAVCDYYGQYFASTAENRHIFLHQARFSTALLQHLDKRTSALSAEVAALCG